MGFSITKDFVKDIVLSDLSFIIRHMIMRDGVEIRSECEVVGWVGVGLARIAGVFTSYIDFALIYSNCV